MNVLRLYYLTAYLGLGAVLPLLALAMQTRGFLPSQYAWLMALLPLSRVLAPPVWGALSDKHLGTRRLLQVNTAIAAGAMLALSQRTSFVLTVLAFAAWAFFSSSLVPLAEAGTYRLLGTKAASFGYIRVFGSIGFAISAIAIGVMGIDDAMSGPFFIAAVMYAVASIVSRYLPEAGLPARVSLTRGVLELARRPDVLLLWGASTLYYAAHGAFDVYFGPYARTIPGFSSEMVSLAWALGVVAEVLMLLVVPSMLHKHASRRLLVFAALTAALRWWLLARAQTPLHVWMLQPLHAVTFGLWYLVFVHENQERAPSDLRATAQGLSAACLGLGTVTATLVGGYVLERLGGRTLFDLACGLACASAVLYFVRARLLARADKPLATPAHES